MDKDGKYTLQACNIRLEASKAKGLVEYYTNKQLLSQSILREKILAIKNSKSFTEKKKQIKIENIKEKYLNIVNDYQNSIDVNNDKYNHLIRLVSPEETSAESAEQPV